MAVDTLTKEEKPQDVAVHKAVRDRVIIWYHGNDDGLLKALDPHFQLLQLRLGMQFRFHYFGYPSYMKDEFFFNEEARKKYQERYEATIQSFERCTLFVPCVSNACMLQMWEDTERDPRLGQIFARPAFGIMPIVLRPTNTGEANPSEPLSAHEGYQREVACRQIAANLERVLRANSNFQPVQKPLATLLFPAPTPSVVAHKKRRWSLFR